MSATQQRGRGPAPKPLDQIHGKRGTYVNRGCRCPACKQANRDYFRERYELARYSR